MYLPQVTQTPLVLASRVIRTVWPLSDVPEDLYEPPGHTVASHLPSRIGEEVYKELGSKEQ